METRELLRSHSSVRKYTGEQLSKETVIDLIETAQMAASSHFVQAYTPRDTPSEKYLPPYFSYVVFFS